MNINGNNNVIIQDVKGSTISLNINGEIHKIQNQLSELKALLQSLNRKSIQYGEKIYNIEHINEANFGIVVSKRIFNAVITKELIKIIPDQEKVSTFLSGISKIDEESWEYMREYAPTAQSIIQESYIWVIAWELRRLFSIGKEKAPIEQKLEDYINHCFSTYRLSLQVLNAILLSKLWDEKKKNRSLNTNHPPIHDFFHTNRPLKLVELRELFQTLLHLFAENALEYPFPLNKELIWQYLTEKSSFNVACIVLENLSNQTDEYDLANCHTAEIHLSAILSYFPFFVNHQLVSMKKIEYEEIRNTPPRYIKDFNILGEKESENNRRIIRYDEHPSLSYVILFLNSQRAINLFPFVLDYNALTNEENFQLFVYEHRQAKSGLKYFCVDKEKKEIFHYRQVEAVMQEIKSEVQKNEQQKQIKIDIVVKQFEDVLNTLLDSKMRFESLKNDLPDFFYKF